MTVFDRVTVEPALPDTVAVADEAADTARYAPSIHNTQPWTWIVTDDGLRLFGRVDRRLPFSDPEGRMMTISCGASLCYARATIRAHGRLPRVNRVPMGPRSPLLADVTLGERAEPTAADTRMFNALLRRRTDRRPLRDVPPSHGRLMEAVAAADGEGAHLHVLTHDQVIELAVAAAHAAEADASNDGKQREIREWITRDAAAARGVPETTFPNSRVDALVPPRFPLMGESGRLASDGGAASAAAYLLLFTDGDAPLDWLRAGEALGFAWATLIEAGMAVMPLSAVVEQPASRAELYGVINGIGHPMLVLRAGYPRDHVDSPPTGREPSPSGPLG